MSDLPPIEGHDKARRRRDGGRGSEWQGGFEGDDFDRSYRGGPVSQLTERIVGNRILMQLMGAVTILAVLIYGTATFPIQSHIVLSLLAVAIALVVTRIRPEYRLVSVVLSIAISLRYIIWRGLETLNLDSGPANAVVSIALYGAEIYTVFVLVGGYFQTTVFLERKPAPLPMSPDKLPSVDVMIPTYTENADIVRRTAVSAQAMDYPNKKVWILDDGRREEMRRLAEEIGCGYITRRDNEGAKAGNINNALRHTDGEFVAFFDADHAPVRSFLTLTIGFFIENDNLALVQTPHHFYNPDPFERNLYVTGHIPPEQNFFYHLVQVSNDFWNSAFFCGSCAVIRRRALEEIGGVATETVTEDAHTSLKMQAAGWDSAYLNIPQAAGLATERFSAYVGQRVRWARGMTQILRMDPPLLKRGLHWYQRLNYTFAASHFLFGLPRMVFLLAPVTYLAFGLNPLDENVITVLFYAIPHLLLAYINANAVHGRQRRTFWPEVYETAIAPYTAIVTLVALIMPRYGAFNVTPKGSMIDRAVFDWRIARLSMLMWFFCVSGVGFFFWRYAQFPEERVTLWVALVWNIYNLILLTAAVAVALERPQRRAVYRIHCTYPLIAHEAPVLGAGDDTGEIDREDLGEPSYAPVDTVDPNSVYRDAQIGVGADGNPRPVSPGAAAMKPSLKPGSAPQQLGWRVSGQSLDMSEAGIRFLIAGQADVPRHMHLTVLGDDGSRLTIAAETLGAYATDEGTVVRARFPRVTTEQHHHLIRLMFSDPNAWTGEMYAHDRLTSAALSVLSAPLRAMAFSLKFAHPPAPPVLKSEDNERYKPVLQCYHCHGVLYRPMPVCPHCGETLMGFDEAAMEEAQAGTLSQVAEDRRREFGSLTTYLVPALFVLLALTVGIGATELINAPRVAISQAEGLQLKYAHVAHTAVRLADDLDDAVSDREWVDVNWGSRVTELRQEFPRKEDGIPMVYNAPEADRLATHLFELHELEHKYREKTAGSSAEVRSDLAKIRDAFTQINQ